MAVPVLSRETLRQCVIAGAKRVIAHRDHLNEINVFPVPDRDTGTNLAATMRAIIAALGKPLPSLDAVGATLATSALAGAQGNSGVILAQFFQGLREGIGDGVHVTTERFATAMRHAALRARQALAQPREGTILTVMSDVAEHLGACCAERAHDFRSLLDEGLRAARRSLAETPQRLAVLRHAGVVDAGALGFVHFLEGVRDHLFHETISHREDPQIQTTHEDAPPIVPSDEPLDFRYCTEAVVRGTDLRRDKLLALLSTLGDSVVVAGTESLLHAHVHTNVPAVALEALADAGTLASTKVDDMWSQLVLAPADTDRSGTAVVTDSVCDLPIDFVTARRIQVVPFRVAFGDDDGRGRCRHHAAHLLRPSRTKHEPSDHVTAEPGRLREGLPPSRSPVRVDRLGSSLVRSLGDHGFRAPRGWARKQRKWCSNRGCGQPDGIGWRSVRGLGRRAGCGARARRRRVRASCSRRG